MGSVFTVTFRQNLSAEYRSNGIAYFGRIFPRNTGGIPVDGILYVAEFRIRSNIEEFQTLSELILYGIPDGKPDAVA